MTVSEQPNALELGASVPSPAAADGGEAAEVHRNGDAADATLFYLAGATSGTVQWKAETFQLVNWGGFEGHVRFDLHPGATLISGASGTGKSSLLDAYIALMMPSDTPFNGASNDAVTGRARSAEQRNLLSYVRGQTDTTADEDGRNKAKVLRGDGCATWGAVAVTFVNDHRQRFTALRIYHVPRDATRTGDITMRMATFDGFVDVSVFEAAAGQAFPPKQLKALVPGLATHDSYSAFANRLYARLGIGANGDGAKALRLLERVQAGHQIRTVDELYKEMVLEVPATFEAADRAIGHFDDLEKAYDRMRTEQQKADLLAPIVDRQAELVAARETMSRIDTFGLTRPGDTPLVLWRLRTEQRLLDAAVEANAVQRQTTRGELSAAREAEQRLDGELDAAKREHHDAGGAQLEHLARELDAERDRRADRVLRRDDLVSKTLVLDPVLADRESFDRLSVAASTFLTGFADADQELLDRKDALGRQMFPLQQRKTELVAERDSFAGRTGRVPKYLDDMRRQVCAAIGLNPDELPFLAELVDLAPEHTRWRTAVEVVLAVSARLLLVPADQLDRFSAAIDPLQLRHRLTFEGVPLNVTYDPKATDPHRVAGKLLFKDTPFTGWVHAHVTHERMNALCVERPAELNGPGYRVTVAGQTRRGMRGSHGRGDTTSIIGFSSADTVAELNAEIAALDAELDKLARGRSELDIARRALDDRRRAHEAVLSRNFDDIDVAGSDARIAELERARDAILAADDRLRALAARVTEVAAELEEARGLRFALQRRRDELDAEHGKLCERQDAVTAELDRVESEQQVILDDEQQAQLDAEFAAAVGPRDPFVLADFDVNLAQLHQRLLSTVDAARDAAQRAEQALATIFSAYLLTWPNPNLGQTAASYPDYAEILQTIQSTGLHQRRAEWRARLVGWSGEDLVPLNREMENAVDDIEERLDPINSILASLPFGATRDRLRIRLRRLTPEHVTQFRRELRVLSGIATKTLTDDQLEARFVQLREFMSRLRRRDDHRAKPDVIDRDRLLDVRKHVEITAERYAEDGRLLSTHSTLGGKSGGESQELVAFIVGAALRFRLGDEERARPRFAPVFLDEGFVKSDAEFAGRAVQAWKGLGFQLVVSAPLDKVTALEPHMDSLLAVTKNQATNYSFVAPVTDTLRRQPPR